MEFNLQGKSMITLDYEKGNETSTLVQTKILLSVDDRVDHDHFFKADGLPSAAGTKALSQCFTQGLVANIHQAHENGYWNNAEHLRYIIQQLENGFAHVGTVGEGEYPPNT